MSNYDFHNVETTNNTITMVTRGDIRKQNAEVVKLIGKREICPFSKQMPENELWEVVEEMLK